MLHQGSNVTTEVYADWMIMRYMHKTGRLLNSKTLMKYRYDLNECLKVFESSPFEYIDDSFMSFYRCYLMKKHYSSSRIRDAKWRMLLNIYESIKNVSQIKLSFRDHRLNKTLFGKKIYETQNESYMLDLALA